MFTSKQRSNLRSRAGTLSPIAQVGKDGASENQIKSLSEALEARELIKISVLNNFLGTAGELAAVLAEKLNAEVVAVIGKKIILYRKSKKENFEHIEF